jgi:biopolymer transport protein ExbB
MAGVIFRGLLQPASVGGGGLWSFSKTITIDSTKCGTANVTDYPLLFSSTIAALKTTANGGNVESASGYDIAFFSDAGLTSMLDFEIESWSATTGAIVAWVRMPTLTFAADAVIYLGYGNATIVASQQNVAGTWDANYGGVWHLGDGVNNYNTAMRADSTANGNTLGNVPGTGVAAAGIVGGGLSMSGGHGLWAPSDPSLVATSAFTVEVWAQPSNFAGYRTMLAKGFGSVANYKLLTDITTGVPVIFVTSSSVVKTVADGSAMSTSAMTYLVGHWDGTTLRLYRDGVSVGTPLAVGSVDDFGTCAIGALDQNNDPMVGLLDEARVSTVARSTSYITATYNNISSPSTFYAVT